MSDNVTIDSMSGGSVVATDNIGDVQYQRVKITVGNDGTAVGDVYDGRPLPTSIISGTIALPANAAQETGGNLDYLLEIDTNTSAISSNTNNLLKQGGSVVVTAGTVQATLASPGTITSGSIAVTAGTVGTVGAVGQVHNAGTIAGGTVGVVQSVSQVVTGTIANSGTTTGVGVVSSLTAGTVAINAGTIGGKAASGAASVANPVQIAGTDSGGTVYSPLINTAGAIGSVANIGTIKEAGTVTGVGVVTSVGQVVTGTIANSGTTTGVGVVSNLTNGSIKVTSGTVNAGTINAGTINTGTINSGTINVGTISPVPSKMISVIGSVWGTNSATAGTLIAAPTNGSAIYLNEVSITNEGTTTLTAGFGFGTAQQGTTVITRAAMAGNGGIEKPFPVAATGGGTQAPLVMWTTGSGTAFFSASYFIAL